MRHIKKILHLEELKSRTPSFVKSYNTNGGEAISFSLSSLTSSNIVTQGNYNMCPMSIKVPIGNNKNLEVLSWYTIGKRYKFMQDYKNLLNNNQSCGFIQYKKAIDYYNHEINNSSNDLLDYYINLDDTYEKYGGDFTYEWLSVYCFQKYLIPWGKEISMSYYNEWGVSYLYYYDILKWRAWFEQTQNTCREEYNKKGGDEMYNWLLNVTYQGSVNDSNYIESTISFPIMLTNNVEDMGMYTLWEEEWEKGNTYSYGSIVTYNDEKYRALANLTSYKSPDKDIIYWAKIEDDSKRISAKSKYYAYKNGVLKESNTESGLTIEMSDKYNINIAKNDNTHLFLIQNQMIESQYMEYVVYEIENGLNLQRKSNGKKCIVKYKYKNNNSVTKPQPIPYIIVGGRTIEGKTKIEEGAIKNYFIFDKKTKKECEIKKGEFIYFNNEYYNVTDNCVLINHFNENYKYQSIDKYVTIDNETYPIVQDVICTLSLSGLTYQWEKTKLQSKFDKIDVNNNILSHNTVGYSITENQLLIYQPFELLVTDEVTGETESKLSSLMTTTLAIDDLGNELPGMFTEKDGEYKAPEENGWMDLYYQVGTVSHVIQLTEKEYFGDILVSMTFYHLQSDGSKKIIINDSINNESELTSDGIYNSIAKTRLTSQEIYEKMKDDTIKCDIEYNIGAILETTINGEKKYFTIKQGNSNQGVKYIDTVTLIPKQHIYWVNERIQFNINYFEVEHDTLPSNNEGNGNSNDFVNKSSFTYYVNNEKNEENYDLLMRQEYLFGISCKEKIEGDIYIDRGISYAFAPHLKLGEVKSLESLEQYGNNSFNIEKS